MYVYTYLCMSIHIYVLCVFMKFRNIMHATHVNSSCSEPKKMKYRGHDRQQGTASDTRPQIDTARSRVRLSLSLSLSLLSLFSLSLFSLSLSVSLSLPLFLVCVCVSVCVYMCVCVCCALFLSLSLPLSLRRCRFESLVHAPNHSRALAARELPPHAQEEYACPQYIWMHA